MRRPRWLERMLERERARPRTAIDRWLARQREYVLRLPRWLVGSIFVGCLSLGVSWAFTGRGLMRWLVRVYGPHSAFPALGTIAFTTAAGMVALLVLARFLRPPPPSNLPTARVRE